MNLPFTKFKKIILCIFLLLTAYSVNAQIATVKGVVKDAKMSDPLIGVSVAIKGTADGVITDINGAYTINNVPGNATLVFSYIGYKTQEISVTSSVINVQLQEHTEFLDEVVVVGYGVQKKSVVTAAISGVKAEDLGKVAPTRVDNVLKGQVSGVTITQQSGQPGEGSKVRIRGIGTINNSDPLFIVDGMPMDDGIDNINPADIESVEVLKDAASAAIYGTRGANGVILVTTKTGRTGKASINYNVSYGWQNPWKKRDLLNTSQYVELINEMFKNSPDANGNYTVPYPNSPGSYANTNWQKELFNNNAPIVSHQLSISGGGDKGDYYLSFGYFNQEGIVGGNYGHSNFDRYTFRFNNNYTLFDERESRKVFTKLKVSSQLSYARIKNTGIVTNDEFHGTLASALMAPPTLPVIADEQGQKDIAANTAYQHALKNNDGLYYSIFGDSFGEIRNPIASLQLPAERHNSDKIIASLVAELEIYKNLNFKTSYGADFNFWGVNGWQPPYYISRAQNLSKSRVWSEMNRGFTWQVENTLTYNFDLFSDHNFTVLLGQSAKSYRYRELKGEANSLLEDDSQYANIDSSISPIGSRQLQGQMKPFHRLASYFGRLSYNYQEKYMAEFTLRRDGSSNFGTRNRWANFPSVSVGWNITNEKFMENKPDWLSSLKLRGSWGKNGNENIDPFNYIYLMNAGSNYPLGKESSIAMVPGISASGYFNPYTKWEESEQIDIGLDSRFLDGALSFTFDWFKKKTNGMLMRMSLPLYVGARAPYANVGDMQNTGVEFDLSYRFNVGDMNFKIGANASYTKNKLIKLGNEEGWANYDNLKNVGTITRGENGQPFPFFYGFKTDGIFQNKDEIAGYLNKLGQPIQPDAKPGDVKIVDVDGDGNITDDDRTKIGKGMPDWTFGINLGVEWKGIDLTANFQGTLGNDIYDATRRTDITLVNLPSYMLDRWHGEGTSNTIPILEVKSGRNWQSSDLFVQNGSFLRLRTLQIGYTLPRNLLEKIFIKNLRINVSAENLLTITSYRGFDPEISSGSNSTNLGASLGIDRGVYPQPRTFSIGANITF